MIFRKFLLFLLLSHTSCVFADINLVYVNGIWNGSDSQSKETMELLKQRLKELGMGQVYSELLRMGNYHNPSHSKTIDLIELQYQAKIENSAIQYARQMGENGIAYKIQYSKHYKDFIGNFYKNEIDRINLGIDSLNNIDREKFRIISPVKHLAEFAQNQVAKGNKVIYIAHSQGNYLLEALDAYLSILDRDLYSKNIRYVGIASTAMTSPNNRYTSIKQDEAIYTLLPFDVALVDITSETYALPHTLTGCGTDCTTGKTSPIYLKNLTGDAILHQMDKVYLSPLVVSSFNYKPIYYEIFKNIKASIEDFATVVKVKHSLIGSTVTSNVNCGSPQNYTPDTIVDGNLDTGYGLCTYPEIVNIIPPSPVSLKKLIIRPRLIPDGKVYYEVQTYDTMNGWVSRISTVDIWKNNQDFEIDLSSTNYPISEIAITVHGASSWVAYREIQGF